jgi:hypothetical protein
VRQFGDKSGDIYVKGAPEAMREICRPESCKFLYISITTTPLLTVSQSRMITRSVLHSILIKDTVSLDVRQNI